MSEIPLRDRDHLRNVAYLNASRLDARIAFWKRYGGEERRQFGGGLVEGFTAPPGANILEVGCGTGEFWMVLAGDVQPGWSLTLSDLSIGMLSDARARLSAAITADVRYLVADVQDLPFAGSAFDVAMANYMLYHLPAVGRGLGEIARVLRADGALYAATNGEDHLREVRDLRHRFSRTAPTDVSAQSAFSLQNGGAQLRRHFEEVAVFQQDDQITVGSADSLVLYLESFSTPIDLEAALRHIEAEMRRLGHYLITRSSGYFVAKRPKRD